MIFLSSKWWHWLFHTLIITTFLRSGDKLSIFFRLLDSCIAFFPFFTIFQNFIPTFLLFFHFFLFFPNFLAIFLNFFTLFSRIFNTFFQMKEENDCPKDFRADEHKFFSAETFVSSIGNSIRGHLVSSKMNFYVLRWLLFVPKAFSPLMNRRE